MRPLIGILICGFEKNRQYISHSYIKAVSSSGGIPVVIPYSDYLNSKTRFENSASSNGTNQFSSSALMSKYFDICDGFLFCGGEDVTPLLFGEELLTDKGHTDLKTDRFHLLFMEKLLTLHLPVLAICRGMQILNLALGGSIYQDLSLRPAPSLNHMQLSAERSDVCHKISVQKESMLYNICGSVSSVNSFHHQCIKTLGTRLSVSAVASDGIVEAVEIASHPFAIGVQWHPECMCDSDTAMQNLFLAFTEASKNSKKLLLI